MTALARFGDRGWLIRGRMSRIASVTLLLGGPVRREHELRFGGMLTVAAAGLSFAAVTVQVVHSPTLIAAGSQRFSSATDGARRTKLTGMPTTRLLFRCTTRPK